MRIAGLEKSSFVDYPGKLAAAVFMPGCNLDCFYCHNRHLLAPGEGNYPYEPREVLRFLAQRRGLLDAVVVSGGEPTLQKGLDEFLAEVRSMGFRIKLDTNGTRPWILAELIGRGLLDFVAMDIKAPPGRYSQIAGVAVDIEAVEQSIDLLMRCGVEYEFRTTFAPPLGTADILAIAVRIRGAGRYVIQQYRPPGLGVDLFGVVDCPQPHPPERLYKAADLAGRFVKCCTVRGLGVEAPASTSPPAVEPDHAAAVVSTLERSTP